MVDKTPGTEWIQAGALNGLGIQMYFSLSYVHSKQNKTKNVSFMTVLDKVVKIIHFIRPWGYIFSIFCATAESMYKELLPTGVKIVVSRKSMFWVWAELAVFLMKYQRITEKLGLFRLGFLKIWAETGTHQKSFCYQE